MRPGICWLRKTEKVTKRFFFLLHTLILSKLHLLVLFNLFYFSSFLFVCVCVSLVAKFFHFLSYFCVYLFVITYLFYFYFEFYFCFYIFILYLYLYIYLYLSIFPFPYLIYYFSPKNAKTTCSGLLTVSSIDR